MAFVFIVRRWYRSEMLVSGQERHPKIRRDDKARADNKAQVVRGPRARMRKIMLDAAMGLMNSEVQPLKGRLGRPGFERLTQSLSLVLGTEAFVVLKDIWGLDRKRAEEVALWTCHALIQAAVAEDGKAVARVQGGLAGKRKNGMHASVALLKKKTRIKVK